VPRGQWPRDPLFARSSICDAILGTADQNSGAKDQKTSDEHLECCDSIGVSIQRLRMKAMMASSTTTTHAAIVVAVRIRDEIGECVAKTTERRHETADDATQYRPPRPVSEPLSDRASAKPIEMPAPSAAARPRAMSANYPSWPMRRQRVAPESKLTRP